MPPRPRRRKNRDLPPNLYITGKWYRYKHPHTGKFHGLGTDRAEAIKAANILNQRLMVASDYVTEIIGAQTIGAMLDRYLAEYVAMNRYAPKTLEGINQRVEQYRREMGDKPLHWLTLAQLSHWLKPLTVEAYRKHRGEWIKILRFAKSVGMVDENVAESTLQRQATEKTRMRWEYNQFKTVRDNAEPWLQVAMDLALVTLLRRQDLVNLRYDMIRGDHLYVKTSKTVKDAEHYLAIHIGPTLREIIDRSRQREIVCPYIIARKPTKNNPSEEKTHPFQVLPGYLTRAVAAVRDASGLFDGHKAGEKPTVHEIRSLGAHLYRCALVPESEIQALMAHEDAKMTARYLKGYGAEWLEVGQHLT